MYLAVLLAKKPYKRTYDNFGIQFNQVALICCLGIFAYIFFIEENLNLNVVLICVYGIAVSLFFSVIYGYFRIYYCYK